MWFFVFRMSQYYLFVAVKCSGGIGIGKCRVKELPADRDTTVGFVSWFRNCKHEAMQDMYQESWGTPGVHLNYQMPWIYEIKQSDRSNKKDPQSHRTLGISLCIESRTTGWAVYPPCQVLRN